MPPQPSGKAVKKAGKAQKAVRASDKKKKRKRRKESFSIYIYKVIGLTNCNCDSVTNILFFVLLRPLRSWSKSTPTLVSRRRPCPSWTRSWTTSSSALPPKPLAWPTTTSDRPSHLARSKLRSDFSCLVNWPSTPSLKEPKPSPSTLHRSRSLASSHKRPF